MTTTSKNMLASLFVALSALPVVANSDHPFETDAMRVPALTTGGSCVVRGATIHSAVGEPVIGDVLIIEGKIKAIGEVDVPAGLVEIDGTDKHLAPGVVDCHSHMAIERGINEGTVSITADVDISDSVNSEDITIYRALAGGVTTARLLHGSANAIGGKHEVIKLKWGRTADELRFPDAPEGIKFALGENVKRSNWGNNTTRFPASRLGTSAVFQRAFTQAREYKAQWVAFEAAKEAGADLLPPRRDLRLDTLVGILDQEIAVHCHCYRADGILMIIRTAQEFGFKIGTLQHVLEGYKVAKEMADAGVPGSTFGDWWSYKIEAYDAVPQNAALMDDAGVLSSVNSDSDEMVRRLYGEAAKSVRYAGLDPLRALRLVTLNPARQLGIDARVGSIEVGKDADLVLMTGDPLSSLARVVWTMVDGEIEFERRDTFGFDAEPIAAKPDRELAVSIAVNPEGGEITAIVGGTLYTVSGPVIEGGTLLIQDGKILHAGLLDVVPAGARVIDAAGKHVWPGMIALNTELGIREIGAVRATNDSSEIGGNQPDLHALEAINAESAHFAVTRLNGVTRAQVAPKGGGPLRGQSALVDMDGDTWEELSFVDRDMLHLRFPTVRNDAEKKEEPDSVKELSELFSSAREYMRQLEVAGRGAPNSPPYDPRLEALIPAMRGEQRVALHARNAQTILFALKFVADEKLDAVLYGATEGWKVAERIAESGLPVVVGPVLALPSSRYDPYDSMFANAAVLQRAGVQIALMTDDSENPRNLAFHAAMASSFGLPRAEAMRAISLYPAQLLGVDDRLGSLEPGKIADVVITDGDPLEIASRTEYVFVDGVQVNLANRQSRFYDKYNARLRRLQSEDRR
ncbi:MAG: imidazolonepropionase-like amidohydrolase [Planctomycetota bacterium]|jgi:imidazolonepropionase-like amidohydrolase